MKQIFVLVINHGYEGRSPPIQAFVEEHEARAALALLKNSFNRWEIFAVPIWPEDANNDNSDSVMPLK
jgi:hypothetical protein